MAASPRASARRSGRTRSTATTASCCPARCSTTRCHGPRRGRLHREHGGGGQRGHRRTEPAGHPPPRHAVHPAEGLGRHPGREGRPGMSIPSLFAYTRAGDVDEALRILASDDGAKVIAGGQSLLPLMKLRLASAETLVDIGGLGELKGISKLDDGRLSIGALTTYAELMESPAIHYGVLRDALPSIGDVQVRNRGTVGGAVAHADPASDLPAALLALGAELVLQSSSGTRTVPA